MSIKKTEKFNNVPVEIYERDGRDWATSINVAQALEYAEPNQAAYNIISRNETDFEGHTCITNLVIQGQVREVRLLDRQGADIFAMLSKTPKATQFRRWIATVLHERRELFETSSSIDPLFVAEQMNTQISLIIESNKMTIERVSSLEHEKEEMKEALRMSDIGRYQRTAIKRRINVIVANISEDHNLEKKFIYPKVWSWFKDIYNITSYETLPKTLFADAIETLNSKIIDVGGLIPKDGY